MLNIDNNFEEKTQKNNETNSTFYYSFTDRELKALARFLRKNQNTIPKELDVFARKIELSIYDSMSIDEVEKFYS